MRKAKSGEFRSTVYTNRPPYADFDAPQKFEAIKGIGLKRTGCCGCAISARAAADLELIRPYEPNVVRAAWAIFGDSYRYREKYNEYKRKRMEQERRGDFAEQERIF